MHSSRTARRPSRSSKSSSGSSASIADRLTPEQLDRWEHAALLYHSYDWNNAAEIFRQLSYQISDVEAATLCGLNAAMIQANLGEYELAAAIVEHAAKMDQDLIFTPYVMGIIDWELEHLVKAEACLDVCLRALGGGDISFIGLGLNFVLRSSNVRRQLSALKVDASGRFGPPTAIGPVIPAECIFEPPSRSETSFWYKVCPRASLDSIRNRLERDSPTIGGGNTLRLRRSAVRSAADVDMALSRPTPPSESLTRQSVRRPSPLRIVKKPVKLEPAGDASPSSLGTVQTGYSSPSIYPRPSSETWPRAAPQQSRLNRLRPPLTARDAHGGSESVRELASFIRRAHDDKTAAIAVLQPRDATAHAASTKELAKFLKHAGKSRPLIPQTDLDLFHDDDDEEEHDAAAVRSITKVAAERGPGSTRRRPVARVRNSADTALRSNSPSTPATASFKQKSSKASTPVKAGSPLLPVYDSQSIGPQVTQLAVSDHDYSGVLPTTTYKAPPKGKGRIPLPPPPIQPPSAPPRLQELELLSPPDSPRQDRQRYPAPWNIHTAGSSTSSLYAESMMTVERQAVARDAALRMLEGRARPAKQKAKVARLISKTASLSSRAVNSGRRAKNVAVAAVKHVDLLHARDRWLGVSQEATKMDSFDIMGLGRDAGGLAGGMREETGSAWEKGDDEHRRKKEKVPKKKWDWR